MSSELKYKLTIDAENLGITEDLYNFPAYIYLDDNFCDLFEGSTTDTTVGTPAWTAWYDYGWTNKWIDEFDGSVVDDANWTTVTGGGNLSKTGGQLVFTHTTGTEHYSTVNSDFIMTGDFEITIYFDVSNDVGADVLQVGLGVINADGSPGLVGISKWNNSSNNNVVRISEGSWASNVSGFASATQMGVRIKRVYDAYTYYYYNGSTWVSATTRTYTLLGNNTKVQLYFYAASTYPTVTASISKFEKLPSVDKTVLDFLDGDAEFRRLAITHNENRCYTEVVYWDGPNRIGCLCVKLPVLSAGQDTTIYLSYDPNADPDFTYVGETATPPAKSVWDENFIVVYHMWQFSSYVLDSTTSDLFGTAYNFGSNYRHGAGHLGRYTNAYAYNNVQYINVGLSQTIPTIKPNYITMESIVNIDADNLDLARIIDRCYGGYGYNMCVTNNGKVRAEFMRTNTTNAYIDDPVAKEYVNEWNYYVGTYEPTGRYRLYRNGECIGDNTFNDSLVLGHYNSQWLRIGDGTSTPALRGFISNIRLSNIARSPSWIKATSASNWNTLFTSVERYAPRKYNVSVVGDHVYGATSSGIKISSLESGLYISFLPMDNTTTVWANEDYIYIGTTSSGIHRYDTALLTCLGEYKDYPDITASEIKYLHGNGNHLCVITTSGVNYIDTHTDSIIGTDTVYADKCFQTSTGQFYYTCNASNYYTSENDWAYLLEITIPEPIVNDDTFMFSVPKEYLMNRVLANSTDLRMTTNSGKPVPVVLVHSDFRGCYLLSSSGCAGVTKLHLLYGNPMVPFDSGAVAVSGTTNVLDLVDYRYGFPSPAWASWNKNGTFIENMVYYDDNSLNIFCRNHPAQDHDINIYSDHFVGNATATIMFSKASNYSAMSNGLWLRFYTSNGSYWCGICYAIESGHYIRTYLDNLVGLSGSIGLNSGIAGLRVYKINSGLYMCWYSSITGTWTYLSHTFPQISQHLSNEPFYVGLSYTQTVDFPDATYSISEFTIAADEFYGRNTINLLPKNNSYSEVNSIKNLSVNWTPETVSHRFTSDSRLIKKPRIDSRIKISNINDIYVAENTSRYGGNTIFLGTNYGASIIEEVDTNYSGSNGRYYLIKPP